MTTTLLNKKAVGITSFALMWVGGCGQQAQGPATILTLKCSLPVSYMKGMGQVPTNGFVTFPGASFATVAGAGLTYDWPRKLWLPVERNVISPDGGFYAETKGSNSDSNRASIHVVEIATGVDRELWRYGGPASSELNNWPEVIGFTESRIFVRWAVDKRGSWTLWTINPGDKAPTLRQLEPQPSGASWYLVGSDAIWGSPDTGGGLMRFDLKTNTVETWLSSGLVDVVGFDQDGSPLAVIEDLSSQTTKVVKVVGPNRTVVLADISIRTATVKVALIDEHGTWFGDNDGSLYFAPRGGRVGKVATVTAAIGNVFLIAGPCK
jgi:hypothetical protein